MGLGRQLRDMGPDGGVFWSRALPTTGRRGSELPLRRVRQQRSPYERLRRPDQSSSASSLSQDADTPRTAGRDRKRLTWNSVARSAVSAGSTTPSVSQGPRHVRRSHQGLLTGGLSILRFDENRGPSGLRQPSRHRRPATWGWASYDAGSGQYTLTPPETTSGRGRSVPLPVQDHSGGLR